MNAPLQPGGGDGRDNLLGLMRAEADRIEHLQQKIARSVRTNFIILTVFAVILGFNLAIQFIDLVRKFG